MFKILRTKTIYKLLALVFVACAVTSPLIAFSSTQAQVLTQPPTDMSTMTIGQIAAGNPNFSTLVNLTTITNLTSVLNGPLPLTVFAPTNDAFAKLSASLVQSLLANQTLLKSILAYHVIPNVVLAPNDIKNFRILPTADGLLIQVMPTNNNTIIINNASLAISSIRASNGIIYVIDTVLTPPPNAATAPLIVPANQTTVTSPFDLTNQKSPYAAALISNFSFTKLVPTTLPAVNAEMVADGFTAPMMVVSPPDNTGRLFIVDQIGLVWIMNPDGTILKQPFLNLTDSIVRLNPVYDERGLLSMAFHPNYTENGKIYVHYDAPLRAGGPTNWSHTVHISEFTVSSNPNVVNRNSERILMAIDKPQSNHNGGPVLFGADGYLYLTIGDGGGANDVALGHTNITGNAQDLTKVLGKTMRINVDQTSTIVVNQTSSNLTYVIFSGSQVIGNRPYGIPADNPFVRETIPVGAYGGNITINGTIPPEIYSYGHRNPAFATFYSNTSNLLFVAEAGQQLFEEVNVVRNGVNYGWHLNEGTHGFNATAPRSPPANTSTNGYLNELLVGPIFEGGHDLGVVVVGGHVYWGNDIPALTGKYVFGYFANAPAVTGNGTLLVASPPAIWNTNITGTLTSKDNAMWETQKIVIANAQAVNATDFVRGVFADKDGELYIMMSSVLGPDANTTTGRIYKLTSTQTPSTPTTTTDRNFQAHLSGDEEVPPVATNAQGEAIFRLSQDGQTLSYKITAANIENITQAHIHIAPQGVNGPIVAWLYPSQPPAALIPGRFNGVLAEGEITAADLVGPLQGQPLSALIAQMENGTAFANIHTTQYPNGEIRGQI